MNEPGPLESEVRDRLSQTLAGLPAWAEVQRTGRVPDDGMPIEELIVALIRSIDILEDIAVKLAAEIDRLEH
jgi:hypothetical protein